jgi:hypothetical protein
MTDQKIARTGEEEIGAVDGENVLRAVMDAIVLLGNRFSYTVCEQIIRECRLPALESEPRVDAVSRDEAFEVARKFAAEIGLLISEEKAKELGVHEKMIQLSQEMGKAFRKLPSVLPAEPSGKGEPDRFIVIDLKTGEEPDLAKIAIEEEWAKGLIYCDMEGFAIDQDGLLLLLDECGSHRYCPRGRFKIQHTPAPAGEENGKAREHEADQT